MSQLAFLGGKPVRNQRSMPWPIYDESDKKALVAALEGDNWGGYASSVDRFQSRFAKAHQAKHCILVGNGTVSLFTALMVLGVGPGDEVIVPAYTFVATASAVVMVGARPVFVDIEPETYNISPKAIEEAITPRTKAVIPVHFAGQPVKMEEIKTIADKNKIFIIEDCAHACLANRNNQSVGSFGHIGSFSFQQKKNLTCGEGGALVTNDDELAKKIWSFSNQGRVAKDSMWYGHESIGSNFRLTAFQAQILNTQFEKLPAQQKQRSEAIKYLNSELSEHELIETLKYEEETTLHGSHMYVFNLKINPEKNISKSIILKALRAEGIDCTHSYRKALYRQKCFSNVDIRVEDCPVTEDACLRTVSLPHPLLLEDQNGLEDIVKIIQKVLNNIDDLEGIVRK